MTPPCFSPHDIVQGDVDRIVQERFFPGKGALKAHKGQP